jgi:hypothetical protein
LEELEDRAWRSSSSQLGRRGSRRSSFQRHWRSKSSSSIPWFPEAPKSTSTSAVIAMKDFQAPGLGGHTDSAVIEDDAKTNGAASSGRSTGGPTTRSRKALANGSRRCSGKEALMHARRRREDLINAGTFLCQNKTGECGTKGLSYPIHS